MRCEGKEEEERGGEVRVMNAWRGGEEGRADR